MSEFKALHVPPQAFERGGVELLRNPARRSDGTRRLLDNSADTGATSAKS